jgi:photosystem II stability/assembly factor-like uncharacterized protein
MKKHFILLLFLAVSAGLYFGFDLGDNTYKSPVFTNPDLQGTTNPYYEKEYFARLYEPYTTLTVEQRQNMAREVERTPDEINAINNWISMGPFGQRIYGDPGTNYYSGRILDIEVDNGASTRIASASGGVWGFFLFFPIPLSDNLTSTLNIGSFVSKPGDANTILVGTGEGAYNNGSGLYRTTNGGTTYTNIAITGNPGSYFKIRFEPGSTTKVHAATSTGYYKSTDAGLTWTRYQLTARVTDLAIDPANTNNMYAPVWGDGLYKSVNNGTTWTKLTAGGIPATDFGRASISLCNAAPGTVYVNVSKNSDDQTLGVYKTINAGTSWTNVTPVAQFHNYGWYNAACGVSPTDANRIIVGGLPLYRSTNGGTSWTQIANAHADQHIVTWNAAGTSVWVGNDGGMFFSADAGMTFEYNANLLPITQYYLFDCSPNGNYCYGGSQDNGISGTTNRGTNWYHYLGGDGGGTSIDYANPTRIMATNGLYGGSWLFQRLTSSNGGQTWTGVNTGVDPNTSQWNLVVKNDQVPPVYFYNMSGPYVYRTTNNGTNWTKFNASAFSSTVLDLSIKNGVNPPHLSACLSAAGVKLMMYNGSTWTDRSAGLGSGTVHHVEYNTTTTAYAVMNGLTAGQKIYKTTNEGATWTNVSGDLPNVSFVSMIPHPTNPNLLYAGSLMGCYKTTNGGTNWVRWNNGLANATQVSQMAYIDSISTSGKFFVVASTFGRSVYYRDISGDDPNGILNYNSNIPKSFALSQNFPNPFNPLTKIKFAIPKADNVKLSVYDINGKLITYLINGEMKPGTYTYSYDGTDMASGVYFYRLETSSYTETKKMMLIK